MFRLSVPAFWRCVSKQTCKKRDDGADRRAGQRPEHPVALAGVVGRLVNILEEQHSDSDGRGVGGIVPEENAAANISSTIATS